MQQLILYQERSTLKALSIFPNFSRQLFPKTLLAKSTDVAQEISVNYFIEKGTFGFSKRNRMQLD